MEMGKAIRKVFIPKDGYVFIDADYSQIELRILAHMSGDEKLIEAYNSSADIHRATAAEKPLILQLGTRNILCLHRNPEPIGQSSHCHLKP